MGRDDPTRKELDAILKRALADRGFQAAQRAAQRAMGEDVEERCPTTTTMTARKTKTKKNTKDTYVVAEAGHYVELLN